MRVTNREAKWWRGYFDRQDLYDWNKGKTPTWLNVSVVLMLASPLFLLLGCEYAPLMFLGILLSPIPAVPIGFIIHVIRRKDTRPIL